MRCGSGTAATTRHFHAHHLNSTNVVTNASGSEMQILDYYPYGSTRVNQQTNGFNEGKQFIGQYTDPETNLSYLQARYYGGSKGRVPVAGSAHQKKSFPFNPPQRGFELHLLDRWVGGMLDQNSSHHLCVSLHVDVAAVGSQELIGQPIQFIETVGVSLRVRIPVKPSGRSHASRSAIPIDAEQSGSEVRSGAVGYIC